VIPEDCMVRLLRLARNHFPAPVMIALKIPIILIVGMAAPSGATEVTFRFRPPVASGVPMRTSSRGRTPQGCGRSSSTFRRACMHINL